MTKRHDYSVPSGTASRKPATGRVEAPGWSFAVDQLQHLSVRRRPFLVGRVEHGEIRAGDWFRCPAGILGQVVSIDTNRILAEPDEQTLLAVNREAIHEGDVLTFCPSPGPTEI